MCCNDDAILTKDYYEVKINGFLDEGLINSTNKKRSESSKKSRSKNKLHSELSNENLYTLKETFICIFCGGRDCKHENYLNRKTEPVIVGLNSDRIDENIYASQRPSNELIEKFDLINKFKELNIGLIVNLQRPGEHPYCGPMEKLDESGFAYSPCLFESEGIHVKLCGWKDMNVPDSLNFMLEIVKEMYNYIYNLHKKILVHCHAGYGRTGIVIGCFKIFNELITAEVAKIEIRKKREKLLQTSEQIKYCNYFYEYLRRLRSNFYLNDKKIIEVLVKNQNDLDVGNYKFIHFSYNKYVPLFLIYFFDAIIDLKNKKYIDSNSIYSCLNDSLEENIHLEMYKKTISDAINNYCWDILYTCEDLIIMCRLFIMWLTSSIIYVINPKKIENLENNLEDYKKILSTCEIETLNLIIKFLLSLDDNDSDNDSPKILFYQNLSIILLGYKVSDVTDNDIKKENVAKLLALLYFLMDSNNKNTLIKNEETNEEEEQCLKSIFDSLHGYFEEKKGLSSSNINTKKSSEMLNNINNLIKNRSIFKPIVLNNNKSYLKSEEKEIISNIPFKISRLGVQLKNSNNEVKNKTEIIDITKYNLTSSNKGKKKEENKNLRKNVIDIIKEEANTPWIREDDC